MEKISEMIERLCPEGVKNYRLGDFCEIKTGRGITKMDASDDGIYPIVSGGIEPMGFYKEYNREAYTVTVSRVGANAGVVLFHTRQFYLNDKCFSVIPNNQNTIENKFLYYYLCNIEPSIKDLQSEGGVPTINTQKLGSVEIPLPPLSIQQEIVCILDSFTSMITNLETELASRQKQYEHYRNKLLTFDENDESVEWKLIGSFTRVFSASRVHKNEWKDSGVPFWRSSDVMSYHNGVDNNRGKVYISYELYEHLSAKSGKIGKGDLLVTGGGSIGMPYIVPSDDPLYVKDADLLCIVTNEIVDNRFLYKYMMSTKFREYLKRITHDASIPHYTISQIKETPVPVLTLSRQSEIVSTLDTFESLITNIKRELDARKKQYEYYREQLLTFRPSPALP